jgi:hypothetical protein
MRKIGDAIELEIRSVNKMGRGVFAGSDIEIGSVLTVNATWPLSPADLEKLDSTSVAGHWFNNPSQPNHGLLTLGLISLLNHFSIPNAQVYWEQSEIGWIAVLKAIAPIKKGEQILIDYGLTDDELPFLHD